MKTRAITSFLTLCAGCTLVFAQSKFVVEDDIYYQPNETNKVVEAKKAAARTQTTSNLSQPTYSTSQSRNVDEYNRRYTSEDTFDIDINNLEEGVVYENPDKGYYLNGFNGSNSDYEYAERIRKFHNPRFTVHFSDPAFNNLYFLNSSDWNVYIDDNYAWVTPTWTNPWYWNYMWSPFSYTSMSWRWGWGSPSWSFGWGPSWTYGPGWYDPFWGPSWGPSWGYYPHHHYPSWGHAGYPGTIHRPGYKPNYRPNNVTGSSPRNPYYGRENQNYNPGANRRPGTSVGTQPNNNNGQNQNIRPGNIRPGNTRPSTTINTGGNSSRPSSGTNVRPGNNGSTSRPSGDYTRPSRNNGNSGSSNGSYTRPSNESHSGSSSRPAYNNSGSDYRHSSGSGSYGGGRSTGGGGGRGGRR